MFYHVGNSQHTQNIRINKVIGENKNCVFYFTEKIKWTFWPTQYTFSLPGGNGDTLFISWAEADSPLGRNKGPMASEQHPFASPGNSVAELHG